LGIYPIPLDRIPPRVGKSPCPKRFCHLPSFKLTRLPQNHF